jgi:hypothetical protein
VVDVGGGHGELGGGEERGGAGGEEACFVDHGKVPFRTITESAALVVKSHNTHLCDLCEFQTE